MDDTEDRSKPPEGHRAEIESLHETITELGCKNSELQDRIEAEQKRGDHFRLENITLKARYASLAQAVSGLRCVMVEETEAGRGFGSRCLDTLAEVMEVLANLEKP